jgi:hypothetical protein
VLSNRDGLERETVEPSPCTGLLTQPVRGITFGDWAVRMKIAL